MIATVSNTYCYFVCNTHRLHGIGSKTVPGETEEGYDNFCTKYQHCKLFMIKTTMIMNNKSIACANYCISTT